MMAVHLLSLNHDISRMKLCTSKDLSQFAKNTFFSSLVGLTASNFFHETDLPISKGTTYAYGGDPGALTLEVVFEEWKTNRAKRKSGI